MLQYGNKIRQSLFGKASVHQRHVSWRLCCIMLKGQAPHPSIRIDQVAEPFHQKALLYRVSAGQSHNFTEQPYHPSNITLCQFHLSHHLCVSGIPH